VLAAFMGGLALGAHITGRFADRLRRPLVAYGALELIVGLACAISPHLIDRLTAAYVELARAAPSSLALLTAARAGLTALLVIVPTMAMGGTLPVLSRAIAFGESDERATRLGALYAINTLGGAIGALGSAYLVLPAAGIRATMLGAAFANAAIGTTAI